jgi:RHS repeat-associated protein
VEYTYEPFGATTVTGNDLGNPTRFTGREDDPSGLYYYRARFYSPSAGRFISQDPLGLGSGDTNPYTYVFNQPTSLIDPMGTKPQGSGDDEEIFYRGMSNAEYQNLSETGGLFPKYGESFVTRELAYIQQLAKRHPGKYQRIVEFRMKPGTEDALLRAGSRDEPPPMLLRQAGLDRLPVLRRGDQAAVHVKAELGYLTYGLRRGSVKIFNGRIIGYDTIAGG